METSRESALTLLKTYNQEPFHLRHAFTMEAVMDWYAHALSYGAEADFWSQVGLCSTIWTLNAGQRSTVSAPRPFWRRPVIRRPSSTRWSATAGV